VALRGRAFELRSYAGSYDLKALADGACAYTLGSITEEAFARAPNDLVVPTDSALGAGAAVPVPGSCDHFHYFQTDALRDELRALA
jgi:hypothetical protein